MQISAALFKQSEHAFVVEAVAMIYKICRWCDQLFYAVKLQ